jgi:WD40 repeat protein/serine/threonine protein kinase
MSTPPESRAYGRFDELAEEFAERYRRGDRPSLEEYIDRLPEMADEIREMFPALVVVEQVEGDVREHGLEQQSAAIPRLRQIGDYRIVREVGRGGMGVVYEAEQISLGRRVALKVLPGRASGDRVVQERFRREARAAAKLHHTNIVPVHEIGQAGDVRFYAMQFIDGQGLDAVIRELQRHLGRARSQSPTRAAGGRFRHGSDTPTLCDGVEVGTVWRSILSGRLEPGSRGQDPVGASPSMRAGERAGGLVPPTGTDRPAAGSPTAGDATGPRPAHSPEPSLSPSAWPGSTSAILPGGTQLSSVESGRRLFFRSIAQIGRQVAGGLAYAHARGIVHRDIKPSNLLLDTEGVVWIVDFGLAKGDDEALTQSGDILGTLRYMAPERFRGEGDARADLYALGLTLYELMTLKPAYDSNDRLELFERIKTEEPARPRSIDGRIPRDLETIVLKASDKDPERRYQTAAALAEDLRRFVDDEPIAARRPTELERLWMWARRRPAVAGLIAALFLTLIAGSIVSTVFAVRAGGFARDAQRRAEEARQQRDRADRERVIAQQQRARAEAGEQEANVQRKRADSEAETTRQNFYYAQMHLAQQAWREHRGLSYMRDLLTNWLPGAESPDRRGWEWFYLNSLPYQNVRALTASGVSGRPSTVAWHLATKRLAEGTADGLIRIWDVEREQPTLILRAPAPVVRWWGAGRWLVWGPDGGKLASGGHDGTVHVWETGAGRELHVLREHKSPVGSVAFSSDGTSLAAWGQDGTIRIWDADAGRLTSSVVHPSGVSAGAWSPDGKLLACAHNDGTVTISGTSAGAKITTLRGHADSVCDLAWSAEGARLVSTGGDSRANIWEVASGTVVVGPLRHSHAITSVAWEPNGRRLATGSVDESVKIWDADTGREALSLRGFVQAVTSVSWGPDDRLASGSGDGSVKVWDSIRDQRARVLPTYGVRVTSVSWSPDGKRLASGGDDGTVRIWDPATGQQVRTLKGHDAGQGIPQFGLIRSLAWSPDGTLLASGGLDGVARVWEVASGRDVFTLPADRGPIWAVVWSPDGTRLAAGSQEGTIRVVERLRQMPKVRQFQAHRGRVRSLAWSPGGDRLASGGGDDLVKLWDPIRGAELARMQGHRYWVMSVAWSPDGKRLASASGDRLVLTWDTGTGRLLATMRGHNDFVDAVAWSPDGTQLASAGLDNSVRIWNPRTGGEAFVLRGNAGMFHDVSWSADGAKLAAASSDGQVWVWDATRGFERDRTSRAWPFIERKLASGTARDEDRLAFAQLAGDHKKFAFATRLWAEALKSSAALGDPGQTQHRYQAARAAVLAAAGQGQDEPPLDDAARAMLRGQALGWLKADLTALRKLLAADSGEAQPDLVRKPSDWKQDPDLASIREPAALAKLSAAEWKAFAQLWADVNTLDTTLLQLKTYAPPLLKTAALQAWFGQDRELAATCVRALTVVADTKDPTMAERVAKICSVRPSSDSTHDAALVLARRAVELGEGHPYLVYFQMGLGMAEYRSNHYAAADAALRAASRLGSNNYHVSITSAFYRAMSLFRQGREAEARKLATEAAAMMKPLPADEKNPLGSEDNADDLILWMAYKEAKAMIKFDAALPAKAGSDKS